MVKTNIMFDLLLLLLLFTAIKDYNKLNK